MASSLIAAAQLSIVARIGSGDFVIQLHISKLLSVASGALYIPPIFLKPLFKNETCSMGLASDATPPLSAGVKVIPISLSALPMFSEVNSEYSALTEKSTSSPCVSVLTLSRKSEQVAVGNSLLKA